MTRLSTQRPGRIALESFDAARTSDPVLLALAKRVRVVFDPALQEAYPAKWAHRVSVTLNGGRRLEVTSDHPPGGPQAPLSWEQVVEKFSALATSLLGELATQRAIAIVESLDERPEIADLTRELGGLTLNAR